MLCLNNAYDVALKAFFTPLGPPNLPHFAQPYQHQESEEVSIYRQQNVLASKSYSKSSLYAIKNGCYGPFYCPRCNNHYMWKKNLLRHMKLECGKEPSFQCPICPLKTKHKSSLIGHVRNKHFIDLKVWKTYVLFTTRQIEIRFFHFILSQVCLHSEVDWYPDIMLLDSCRLRRLLCVSC